MRNVTDITVTPTICQYFYIKYRTDAGSFCPPYPCGRTCSGKSCAESIVQLASLVILSGIRNAYSYAGVLLF